eukprot:1778769-Pyramimonas_sp.AAC.1
MAQLELRLGGCFVSECPSHRGCARSRPGLTRQRHQACMMSTSANWNIESVAGVFWERPLALSGTPQRSSSSS